MKAFFASLRVRAALLLGVLALLLLGATAYRALTARAGDVANAFAALEDRAQDIADKENDVIEGVHALTHALVATNDLPTFARTERCSEILKTLVDQSNYLANAVIAGPDGQVWCNSTGTAAPLNITDTSHFQAAVKSAVLVTGSPILARSNGKWSLPFAQAARDKDGHVAAVISVLLDLQWLGQRLAKVGSAQDQRVGLIDGDGVVLARYPDPEKIVGQRKESSPFFRALVAQKGAGVTESVGFDNTLRLYAFAHFAETARGPLYLWVGVSKEAITRNADHRFTVTMIFGLAVAIVLLVVLWSGSERYLIRPIAAIGEAAQRLALGEHGARTGVPHSNTEVGRLARAFDAMATALTSQNQVLRLNRALRVLSEGNKNLVRATSETELLDQLCRMLAVTGGYRMAWVAFAEHDEAKSVRIAAKYGFEAGYADVAGLSWADDERGRGPTGTAIRTGAAQINQDFLTNPALAPWRSAALERGYQSSAAFPLKDGTETFGVLGLFATEPNAFSGEEATLLGELAEDLAYGILTLRLKTAHAGSAERLLNALEGTIRAVATTLDARDAYTGGHQRRVAELAAAIARELGLPPEEIRGLQLAATIHDLGKIAIPAEILAKPSRLTEVEMNLIRVHPQAGYEILKGIEFPWPIAELILQHHERMDGSGYPQGLKGEAILPGARILAVADTVEAMSSHRPYRPARGIQAALAELEKNRGSHYEERVVDACIRLFREKAFAFSG